MPHAHNPETWRLYEDDDLLALNKPAELTSLAERHDPETGLLSLARATWGGHLSLCHRLDRHTTGVIILAKTAQAHRTISLAFQNRRVDKRYWALIHGSHHIDGLEVDAPLRMANHANRALVDFQEGKPAQTQVRAHTVFRHCTLVECRPLTGRPHQLRAHLAYLRSPVVGDHLYGGEDLFLSQFKRKYRTSKTKLLDPEAQEQPLNKGRYLLHARSLTLPHPTTEQPLTIEAPVAGAFAIALKQLAKYDAL